MNSQVKQPRFESWLGLKALKTWVSELLMIPEPPFTHLWYVVAETCLSVLLRGLKAVRTDGMDEYNTSERPSVQCLEHSSCWYMAAVLLAAQQKQNIPEMIPWHHGGPGILATSSQELLFLAPEFPKCPTFVNCIIPSQREQGGSPRPVWNPRAPLRFWPSTAACCK